ncbi:MAG: hypothetical protein ACM3JB_14915 [Acidobacteriaceae bacterium]
MVRRWGMITAFILTLALGLPLLAQDKPKENDAPKPESPWSFYKLTLTVREMDGTKTVSSRSYDFSQRSGFWGNLRVGSRVPILDSHNNLSSFQDIGLNVDSRIEERDNGVAFDWRLELTSLATESPATWPAVVRKVSSSGDTLLTLGKPTAMTTVDDLNSTHKFVFEVTGTKLK